METQDISERAMQTAICFKPFIDHRTSEKDAEEIVISMAKTIQSAMNSVQQEFDEKDVLTAVKLGRKLNSDFLSGDILELIKDLKNT